MDQFNRYLERLADLDVDLSVDTSFTDIEKDLREIAETYEEEPEEITELIEEGRRPLQPFLYNLTVYYPISRYADLPLSPVVYQSPKPITPADIIDSIGAVYRTPLSQETINAYIQIDPRYSSLNEPILRTSIMGGPKLRDVVSGHSESLQPYHDGYRLRINS